jgi:ankyrin repeat protein
LFFFIVVLDYEAKFDKYLNQLKDALTIFVRTNDPSRLFRRTRVLVSKFDENTSPLSDAIERGHVQLALPLIEQVIDMPSPNRLLEKGNANGETPLLIAAKLNHGKLIETILKKRSDLVEQKDKDGNNMFHLLANLSEDKGAETIENILTILPNESKINLLKEKNTKNETPIDIAQSHGNTKFIDLFESSLIDVQQNN